MHSAAPSLDLAHDIATLKGVLDPEAVDLGPQAQVVVDLLARFDALHVIAAVDAFALPAGAPLNIALYRTWLDRVGATSTSAFAIWFNLGIQYVAPGELQNRITSYKNALLLKPDFYQAAVNLGLAYEAAGDTALALATWEKSLQPDEARTALLNHRGRVLENTKQLGGAAAALAASLRTCPTQPDALHHVIGLRTKMCDWPLYDQTFPGVTHADMVAATRALTVMAVFDDTDHLCRANASWIEEKMPAAPVALSARAGYGHAKLRVGYLSSDFCMHPIAYLVAELFEAHDRTRIEVYGYCSTKPDGSAVRQRILESFDHYRDVRAMADEAAARLIRDDEIDILVDLNGLTLGTRLQILRWRPAPIQMTYLGYNGPIPLPELDYIIADAFVVPPALAGTYRPEPLYMPGCFQVNDSKLPIAPPLARETFGLPQDRFVFCSFSNTYKITESVFEGWMTILRQAEDSVLWLLVDNAFAMDNLTARAAAAGLAPGRIIFAGRVEPSVYRSRLALADLFLDTYPYNSGTTASDALRVGLPLITLAGETFTARMAGSLLQAMGLDETITYDQDAYVALAVALARDPARYAELRARVTPERWLATLGDTPRFCGNLEAAFERLVAAASNIV